MVLSREISVARNASISEVRGVGILLVGDVVVLLGGSGVIVPFLKQDGGRGPALAIAVGREGEA